MAQFHSEDILADFAHQVRQPLSALEAMAFYLDLIAKPEDTRVHEQLQQIHAEIAEAEQILREGLCTLRAYCSGALRPPAAAPKVAVVPLLNPLNTAR